MVTRCPKCNTAFRITSAQLQSAKGAVRCGSCLHVFKANDHLVTLPKQSPPETVTPLPTTALAQPAKSVAEDNAPEDTGLEDDDLLISDDMDSPKAKQDAQYEFEGFLDIDVKPAGKTSLFDRPIDPIDKADTDSEAVDESWAEMLMDDEDQAQPATPSASPQASTNPSSNKTTVFGDIEPELAAFEQQPAALTDAATTTTATTESSPPAATPEIQAPTPQEQAAVEQSKATPKPATSGIIFNLVGDKDTKENTAESQESDLEAPDDHAETKRQVKTEPKIRAYDNSRSALLMNIIPAPVEFTATSMRNWRRKLWPIANVIALLVLVIQFAWLKFDTLGRIEPYRAIYAQVCSLIGCQLPSLVETSKIKAYNLVLRSHPNQPGALLVDAIILNTADFDQPFPNLVLTFSDINNQPVAARQFSPQEYLGGELAGLKLMPKNQPIQLSLDLVDPGAEAVNYQVYIP